MDFLSLQKNRTILPSCKTKNQWLRHRWAYSASENEASASVQLHTISNITILSACTKGVFMLLTSWKNIMISTRTSHHEVNLLLVEPTKRSLS
jgi:hypothetical protein